jgi:hypothetical protein
LFAGAAGGKMTRRPSENFDHVVTIFGVVTLAIVSSVLGVVLVLALPFPATAADLLPQGLEGIALGAPLAKVETQLQHRHDVLDRDDDGAANAGVVSTMMVWLKRADKPQIDVFFSDARHGHRVKEIWVSYRRGRPPEVALADAINRYGDPSVIDRVPQDHRIVAAWGGTVFYEGDPAAAHQPRPGIDIEPKPHQRRTLALEIYTDPATSGVTEVSFHLATVTR